MRELLQRRRTALLASASVEISPRDPDLGNASDLLAPGRVVFVAHSPGSTFHDVIEASKKLALAEFVPVPHLAAHQFAGFSQARDFLARAVGEAGVRSVFLAGCDSTAPAGALSAGRELLATGLFERYGIGHVVLPGCPGRLPEPSRHPSEPDPAEELALAREHRLDVSLVTQICLEPEPICRWLANFCEHRIGCTVSIGVAGPASLAALALPALRAGTGSALLPLARRQPALARAQIEITPERIIDALFAKGPPEMPVAGLHVFAVSGLRRTAQWFEGWRAAA